MSLFGSTQHGRYIVHVRRRVRIWLFHLRLQAKRILRWVLVDHLLRLFWVVVAWRREIVGPDLLRSGVQSRSRRRVFTCAQKKKWEKTWLNVTRCRGGNANCRLNFHILWECAYLTVRLVQEGMGVFIFRVLVRSEVFQVLVWFGKCWISKKVSLMTSSKIYQQMPKIPNISRLSSEFKIKMIVGLGRLICVRCKSLAHI